MYVDTFQSLKLWPSRTLSIVEVFRAAFVGAQQVSEAVLDFTNVVIVSAAVFVPHLENEIIVCIGTVQLELLKCSFRCGII